MAAMSVVLLRDNSLWQYNVLFDQGTRQLTVNDYFRNALVDAGAPAANVAVHHMGVRINEIEYAWRSWDQGTLNVISVCRLTEKKGIEFALRALGQLSISNPDLDWAYTIIGGGELLDDLKHLAKDLNIAHRVTFLGPRPHSEVKQRLREAHVFLLPSVTALMEMWRAFRFPSWRRCLPGLRCSAHITRGFRNS